MTGLLGLIRNSIAAFLGWWLMELGGLLPHRFRQAGRRGRRGLVLALGPDESTVMERTAEGERTLGSVATEVPDHDQRLRALLARARRRGRPATVRLPGDLGLRKVLDLPLAARDDLEQMLRFEMDRLTPFKADEVYFAQRLLATDPAAKRISVELHVAPRRVVDEALATTRRLGLETVRVELATADATGANSSNLLRQEPGAGAREARLNRTLALVAVALAVIAVVIPLRRQQATLADLETRVASARAEAEESMALRERIEQLARSAQFLIAEKTGRPMVTEVLAELTQLVPDQAHIIQLELRDGTVQLHGYATAASELIGLFDQSKLFKTPQFRSPVTQDPRSGFERFHLSVEIATPGTS